MQYDAETRRGFWIVADVKIVLVLTITEVADEEEAAAIWIAIEEQEAESDPDKIIAILGAKKVTRN